MWINNELNNDGASRNPLWSESIVFGSEPFIMDIQGKLASRARNRSAVVANGTAILKEPEIPYNALFDAKKALLSYKNTYIWNKNV